MKQWLPVIVAAVAAATALVGYLLSGATSRRAEKTRRYAEALDAIERYRQLPLTFARRHNGTPDRRDELARMLGDVQITLAFYRRWLWLDSPQVGMAYNDVVDKLKKNNSVYRKAALKRPIVQVDGDIEIGHPYLGDDRAEHERCIAVMGKHLRLTRNIF